MMRVRTSDPDQPKEQTSFKSVAAEANEFGGHEDMHPVLCLCGVVVLLALLFLIVAVWLTHANVPLSGEEVERRLEIIRVLIDPEGLPPLWLEALRISFIVLVNYFVFCSDLVHTAPYEEPSAIKYWLYLVIRVVFCLLAIFCLFEDCARAKGAFTEAQLKMEGSDRLYSLWLAVVTAVMSPNYVNSCAIWMFLSRMSPAIFFSPGGMKDPITAWSMVAVMCRGEELEGEGERFEDCRPVLRPNYSTGCNAVPLLPFTTAWLPGVTHIYALILLPYYLFTVLQLTAFRTALSFVCCGIFWLCCAWGFLAVVTLFLWEHARSELSEEWGHARPIWVFIGLSVWGCCVATLCSCADPRVLDTRICLSTIGLHKKFRLIFLLPRFQPKLTEDFTVDQEVMEKAQRLEDEYVNAPEEGRRVSTQERFARLATSVKIKSLWTVLSRASAYLLSARVLVLIGVRWHTMSMAEEGDGKPHIMDAWRDTLSERTMESFNAYTPESILLRVWSYL